MPWQNSRASVSDQTPRPEKALPKPRILVAEDDPVSREIISSRLTKWGYEAVVANDGVEAMAILRNNDAPALAILDWMMPGMDGLEVCVASEAERLFRSSASPREPPSRMSWQDSSRGR
jgi:PleD family two-component response regulator